ncbi:MAG: hypothetical protein WCG27_08635, partial [Pseudomonadota bacterium]
MEYPSYTVLPDDESEKYGLSMYYEKQQVSILRQMALQRKVKRETARHSLRAAIAAIMSRNKSHIHGSHIEHGLRNNMHTFENLLFERFCSKEELYLELREQLEIECNGECTNATCSKFSTQVDMKQIAAGMDNIGRNRVRLAILMENLKEEAHKKMSSYRQRQDDLIARMATEWPDWGCTLDFYTHIMAPLYRNPFVLHFINLSEEFCLLDIEIKVGYHYQEKDTICWVDEHAILPRSSAGTKTELIKEADLIDDALLLLTEVQDLKYGDKALGAKLATWKMKLSNRKPFMVKVRDADIGAQAFAALFEGIIRNASKHGIKDVVDDKKSKEKSFRIRVVACEDWASVTGIVDVADPEVYEDDKYKFIVISVGRDLLKSDDKERFELSPESINKKFKEAIINDLTGELKPGGWGMKEIKICAAFLAGERGESVNSIKPNYIVVGKTKKDKLIWKDGQERLCYVVRILRPTVALIATSAKPTNFVEWEAEGVRFVDKDDELIKKTDYGFFVGSESVSEDLKSKIKQYQNCLPQRIVNQELNICQYESDGLLKPLDLEFDLYKKHLSDRLINNIRLIVYFEDSDKARKWAQCVKSIVIDEKKIAVDIPELKRESAFNRNSCIDEIGIHRHETISKRGLLAKTRCDVDNGQRKSPYYAQHASGSDPFFNFLLSVDPIENPSLAKVVLMQLIESSLLNVLIIDERIALSLKHLRAPDEQNLFLLEKLYWMGLSVAHSINYISKDGSKTVIWTSNSEKNTDNREV